MATLFLIKQLRGKERTKMKKLVKLTTLFLALGCLTAAAVQAAPTAEEEMRKVVEAVAPLRLFSVDVDISLMGSFFDKKPNFPRSGNLALRVNSPSKEKSNTSAKLTLTTVKGPMTFGLANLGKKLYLTIITPEGKNGYFLDQAKTEMKREAQMINGILGSAKGALAMVEKDPGNKAIKQIERKGTLSLPVPGMLKIVDKKNKEKVLTIKYDKSSYMPQIVNFRDNKDGIRGSFHFRNWKKNQNIQVSLPLPLAQYKAFGKESMGSIVQALPKPQEVMSSEPMSVSMVVPSTTGGSPAAQGTATQEAAAHSATSHGAASSVKPTGHQITPAMQRELKKTVSELKSVVEVLKDPKFQRSLHRASSLLRRLEMQLDRMEKLQK